MGAASALSDPQDFYDRDDRPGESICLRCLLTVRGSRRIPLEEAKLEHRIVCAFKERSPIRVPRPSKQI
jgi:hypothetical protein